MKFVEENYENMLADLKTLVSYNSVYSDDVKPFGSVNREVLDKALELMTAKGFNTKNVDYYAGYGEIGQGEEVIGILAHLDIVPVGEGWDTNPLEVVQKGDRLYGRGVSDDKGAAVASMYAMKYLLDTGYEFKKRVRLILGCNEESGSACIEHYVEKEGHVDMGFTPDGEFPGIYAEKGMAGGFIIGKSKIIDIKGGQADNVVCNKVVCTLPENSYDVAKFDSFMKEHNIEYSVDGNTVTVLGVAAHASLPDAGVNAINHLMEALYVADFHDPFVDYIHKYIGLELHGETLGLDALKDETNSSVNLGVIGKNGDNVECTLDIRFPITRKDVEIAEVLNKAVADDCGIRLDYNINPLYYDKNSKLVQSLLKAYRSIVDDQRDMIAIGGGTYAKSMNNIIAFGCAFNEEENHIHDANESLSIEEFKKQVEIYIEAIKNLNEA